METFPKNRVNEREDWTKRNPRRIWNRKNGYVNYVLHCDAGHSVICIVKHNGVTVFLGRFASL